MSKHLFVLILLLASAGASALDRVQLVQAKIQSSLSSILPATDFLVIVNRLDTLDDGGATQVIDGTFKPLPGLQLGVDSKGTVVRQDYSASSYNGGLAINIVIENQVRAETFKTIQTLLPDIIGGLRDDDELKVARGPLRQPSNAQNAGQPSVTINNGEQKNQMQDNIKFLALLLLTGGLFFWFLSRLNFPGSKDSKNADPRQNSTPGAKQQGPEVNPSDFAVLDPNAVALFLLKEIKDKNEIAYFKWIKCAPSVHQREVFRHMPSWVLSFVHNMAKTNLMDEDELDKMSLHELFNEIAMIEQSFKNQEQKNKAFLQWFPAQALRYVPRSFQRTFSDASKKTLWTMRPDLGNFVKVDSLNVDEMMQAPTDKQIEACLKELYAFPNVSFEQGDESASNIVDRWIALINQLHEFSPIESQIQQAKARLSEPEFQKLLHSVGHLRTPFELPAHLLKDWLRTVDAHDYYWWLSLCKEKPTWDLQIQLRPMRLAIFKQAAEQSANKSWNEDDRKLASERLLRGFRALHDHSARSPIRDAA